MFSTLFVFIPLYKFIFVFIYFFTLGILLVSLLYIPLYLFIHQGWERLVKVVEAIRDYVLIKKLLGNNFPIFEPLKTPGFPETDGFLKP